MAITSGGHRVVRPAQRGTLPCLRRGPSVRFDRSMASPRATAARVCGGLDDVVDVAPLGRHPRVGVVLGVLLGQLARSAARSPADRPSASSSSRRWRISTAPCGPITDSSADGQARARSAPIDFEFMTT